MLLACVTEYLQSWDKNLPWAEFSYNNNYQESLKMAPFEVVYGHQCCTSLNWIEPGEKMIFVPSLVEEVEMTVSRIQDNLIPQNHTKGIMQTRGANPCSLLMGIMCI
jgi:hypothetical protein